MSYIVRLTAEALDDLRPIEDFLFEMSLEHGDDDLPRRAVAAIRDQLRILSTNPFTCRKAGNDPHERELVIPFGGTGYIALFRILGHAEVAVSALRHQREEDFH